jgi:hypothetical protein
VSLKRKISDAIYMRCKCVFTLLSGEVLSLMLISNYLTMDPLSWEEGRDSRERIEEIIWIALAYTE